MSGRRLPTLHPTWTDDEGLYIYQWELLGKRLASLLGGKLIDYDPGFKIEVPCHNSVGGTSVEVFSLRSTIVLMDHIDKA